jgi:predicted Rossmann-fold nucleotide-binding protein
MPAIQSICVFCGSSPGLDPAFGRAARDLGRLLAERQITLIYGGGHVGLMGLIADATLDTGGEGAPAHQKQITANAAKRKPPPVTTTFPAAGTAQACRAR